ncbi:HU family DNA-binding protein [Bacteroidota bacterium]
MKKEDIVKIVAEEYGLSEVEVLNYFDDIFDVLIECFRKNKNVNISEFGKFLIRLRLDPEGVKEKIVTFSPVKKLADDVNYYFNNLSKVNLRTLDVKVLDDIVIQQRIDIDLPQDFEEFDIIAIEDVQDEEELLKDYLEPIIEKEEEAVIKEEHIETIKELERKNIKVKEEITPELEIQKEEEHVDTVAEVKEHIDMIEEETQLEEEHIDMIEEESQKEEKHIEVIVEEKEHIDVIEEETQLEEEHIDMIEEESQKEEKHIEVIVEEESKDLDLEQEIIQEKEVEEKSFDVETEMKSFLLEHISLKGKEKETPEIDEYTIVSKEDEKKESGDVVEDISIQEILEKREVDSEEDILSKESYEEEIEEITTERDKIIEEISNRELELSDFKKEEGKLIGKEEISGDVTDEEKPGDEKIDHEKEEELPAPKELDKVALTDVEDVKEEIEKIFAERNKILSEIVELNLDKPELDEKTLPEEQAEPQEVIDKQEVSKEVKSDEDEIVRMIEERQRKLKKIQGLSIGEFKKSPEDEEVVNEEPEGNEESQKDINEENISKEKEEKTEKEAISACDEIKPEEELSVSSGDFEDGEVESIRSGIFSSNNIEEDINKILDERKKIIDNITNLELSVFDKLMEDSEKESSESVINQDIESLTKIKMNLGEADVKSISESTVIAQPEVEDSIDSPLEFKIKEDVKELHDNIVEEDSDTVEEITKDEYVENPRNFDDIFVQDDQKVYAKDNDEENSVKSRDLLCNDENDDKTNEKKDDESSDSKNEKSNKKAFTIPWMILNSLIV